MTLLEIMVVLGIIGFALALGIPRLGNNKNNLKKIMREMGVLGKEIRHQARLKNRTYRLVFDMPEKGAHKYWVESADGPVLSLSKENVEKQKGMDEKERPKSPFQRDEKFSKKDRELPSNLFFGTVEYADQDPVSSGTAYVYFMPSGLVQHALIQVTDRKNATWTVAFNPLTGQADVMESAVSIRDLVEK